MAGHVWLVGYIALQQLLQCSIDPRIGEVKAAWGIFRAFRTVPQPPRKLASIHFKNRKFRKKWQ